jgi:hypothetical protein
MSIKNPSCIVLFEAGRLGNQIFQYQAIRGLFPKTRIETVGFDELITYFDLHDIQKTKGLMRFFWRKLKKYGWLDAFLNLGLMSYAKESQDSLTYNLDFHEGYSSRFLIFHNCYFQNSEFVNLEVCNSLVIQQQYRDQATNCLAPLDRSRPLFFLHIRQGDYQETGWSLAREWYWRQIQRVLKQYPNVSFIVLSDSPQTVSSWFAHTPTMHFFHENQYVDLAIMAQCNGGILSASSFSFWGAYFSYRDHPDGLYIGPKYWIGHARQEWYPPKIAVPWIQYYD